MPIDWCTHFSFLPLLSLSQMYRSAKVIKAKLIASLAEVFASLGYALTIHAKINKIEITDEYLSSHLEELAALYLISVMNTYQQEHKITNQCLTNAQLLYTSVRDSFPTCDIKVVPACAVFISPVDHKPKLNSGHVVVMINGNIYDPSFEITSQDPTYLLHMKVVGVHFKLLSVKTKRLIINNWLEFTTNATRMNANPPYPLVSKKEYYDAQWVFVTDTIKAFM